MVVDEVFEFVVVEEIFFGVVCFEVEMYGVLWCVVMDEVD